MAQGILLFQDVAGLRNRLSPLGGILLVVLLVTVAWLIRVNLRRSVATVALPVVRSTAGDIRPALEEGRRLYPNKAFVIPLEPPIVILPDEVINKVKSVPESQLSAGKEIYRRGLGQYTDLGSPMPELYNAIKVDLTRHVRNLIPVLQEEVAYACAHFLGPDKGEEWTEITVFVFIKRIVTVMNAVAFVGRTLSRNPEWQEIAYNYSSDLRVAFDVMNRWPQWLRPFVHPFVFRKIKFSERRIQAESLIQPLMADSKNTSADGGILMQSVRQRLGWPARDDSKTMARMQLRAALASSDTVAQALTNAIFDITSTPGLGDSLRGELFPVVSKNTGDAWDMSMLRGLSKMDSLFRESARLRTPFLINMGRTATSPLHLEDGTVIPKDTTVYFDMYHAHRSPEIQNDNDLSEFDAFRFSKRREEEHLPNKYLAATTGLDNLTFGHGTQACPGRFFAVAVMKVVLAHLLLNYDMELKSRQRPETVYWETVVMLDRGAKMIMRKRNH